MESTSVPAVLTVGVGRLAAAFAALPATRRAASVRSPLPAVLALAVAARLAGRSPGPRSRPITAAPDAAPA